MPDSSSRQPTESGNLPALTGKRKKFVDLYLGADEAVPAFNATAAARAVGYATPRQEGSRLLSDANVRAHVDAALRASSASRDVALALVADDAFRSIDEIIQASRKVSPGPAESSVISSLLSSRTTARTNLAKAHGLLTDKHQVDVAGDITIEIVGVDTDKL